MNLITFGTTAACIGLAAWLKLTGKTRAIFYHVKFAGLASAVLGLSLFTWPLLVVRGKKADFAWYTLEPFLAFGRYALGLRWSYAQSPEEIRKRVFGTGNGNGSGAGCVVVINHQSCLDILGVVELWKQLQRLRIVAKSSIQWMGPAAIMANYADFVLIDRKKTKEAKNQLVEAVMDSKNGRGPVLVFPEGTRNHSSTSRDMLPFKKGAFVAAVQAGVPIVPVVFSHYSNLNHETRTFKPAVNKITVLEPIQSSGKSVDELTEETRSKMLDVFREKAALS